MATVTVMHSVSSGCHLAMFSMSILRLTVYVFKEHVFVSAGINFMWILDHLFLFCFRNHQEQSRATSYSSCMVFDRSVECSCTHTGTCSRGGVGVKLRFLRLPSMHQVVPSPSVVTATGEHVGFAW